jgi:hypothetical protein
MAKSKDGNMGAWLNNKRPEDEGALCDAHVFGSKSLS